MSNNKMLIDAAHPEETRVVVLRNGRVEEFDYESAARKLLRGNIYLAKVTRVEPSLQAAFVDYGGNRHGFLAFSEIHPDYYQIPVADKELLLREEAEAEAEAEAAAEARAERRARQQEERRARKAASAAGAAEAKARATAAGDGAGTLASEDPAGVDALQPDVEWDREAEPQAASKAAQSKHGGMFRRAGPFEADGEAGDGEAGDGEDGEAGDVAATWPDDDPHDVGLVEDQGVVEDADTDSDSDGEVDEVDEDGLDAESADEEAGDDSNGTETELVEEVGSEDALEEIAQRPRRRARQYKIQEVTKRRQVLLVQVVKEERGTKGAALTTYLSLAGRYTVLMPNSGRGGGISRKITNAPDRKRLKAIANELDVPEGMGLIIRTAGAARTKAEIRRDFEYLLRLWESVRELTLESTAPNLVYEEGNLIKRSIRDLYSKEVDEIVVAGERAHADAKEFMGMLMPSHSKHVVRYKEPEPLFAKYQIERQLNAMFSPYVTLKSGGYIVINQTEALVSVDVNSGKATREFSIEETALKTNMEAAEELSRQLKLRDLAGLIVIDFIDMEERRNNRAVECRIKDSLKNDRARVQVGRISHFGLMEMSRQRMRTGVLEGSTTQCPHCTGTGVIRSTESVALGVLRALEDALLSNARDPLTAITNATVALYIFNQKRAFINEMEDRYDVAITVEAGEQMQGASFAIEKTTEAAEPRKRADRRAVKMEWAFEGEAGSSSAPASSGGAREDERDGKKPRRRRGRGRSTNAAAESGAAATSRNGAGTPAGTPAGRPAGTPDQDADAAAETAAGDSASQDRQPAGDDEKRSGPRRRRGRRGGRRSRERGGNEGVRTVNDVPADGAPSDAGTMAGPGGTDRAPAAPEGETGTEARKSRSAPRQRRPAASKRPAAADQAAAPPASPEAAPAEPAEAAPSRKGWWQRALYGD